MKRLLAVALVLALGAVTVALAQNAGKSTLKNPASLTEKAPELFKVKFDTSKGPFIVEVHRDWAPIGTDRFYNLVKNGFFDDARFFRVISGFMVQFGLNGDPAIQRSWSEARMKDDPVKQGNTRGNVTFAKCSLPDCRSTQVFINYKDNSFLNRDGFAPFGKVISGMEVVDKLYSEYGESAQQQSARIQSEGNAFLAKDFPKLDYIKKATIEK
ncbi:MAG TPA: peptidylprolyl isomerase [Terriglobia bacterium]|nr:peptidylprolyl isomerase [Terriglobia bacterium]